MPIRSKGASYMPGLVLFVHGLFGNRESWGAVPDFVRDSPLNSGFRVDLFEYDGKAISAANIGTSARLLLTALETRYADCDPIYLVGHSLGGLIARELCRILLNEDPDGILNRIGAVITVGTPLEGARRGNRLLRWIPFVTPKIDEITRNHFAPYRDAINKSMKRSARRPRQLHIEIESDRVIASQVAGHFTVDDVAAAVIPGSHQHFAENNDGAKYVADVLVTQIRKSQNSLSRPNIPKTESMSARSLPDRLLLVACSHTKAPGGNVVANFDPAAWIPPPGLRQRVIDKRSYVFSLLNDAKLADGFERGGNRKHQPANSDLIHGPDLGGLNATGHDGKYMAAWQRYGGRFYTAVSKDTWDNYNRNRASVEVLIMSGLYGLLEPNEEIQNYDVHLTDTDINSGQSVSSMWQDLYTEMLNAYIQHAYRGRKVQIVNLLCDEHYVDAIVWHKLSTDCVVYHLASPTLSDVHLLPPAGRIFDALLRNPSRLEVLRLDEPQELSSFGIPPQGLSDTKIVFDSRVGRSKQ
jgi:pimeloyl-ACP methyl ester carboxylesterase